MTDLTAQANGEDVVIHVSANDADRIVWALRRHARHTVAPEYRQMADLIEAAVEEAFRNGALPLPGLSLKLVPR